MLGKTQKAFGSVLGAWLAFGGVSAGARIRRVVVEAQRTIPAVAPGAIRYQELQGVLYGDLSPTDSHNSIIQDLELAPKNAEGRVDYAVTFTLALPEDSARSSGFLLYEVVNRGASIVERDFSQGDMFLTSGWQGDLPFRGKSLYGTAGETIQVPVARNRDGSVITGPLLLRFFNMRPGLSTLPTRAAAGYASSGEPPAPASLDTHEATLTTRAYESVNGATGQVKTVAPEDWRWADCSTTPFPGRPDPHHVCVRQGFDPDLLYQVQYRGKDPLVLGVGLAAMRDVVSFFRYAHADDVGWRNPLEGRVHVSIGQGASQAGNTIRTFLNLGFNQDEAGQRVWDGVMPTLAVRQSPINFRFAVPGGASSLYEAGSDGVVWWTDWPDPVRHQTTSGLLHRCTASQSCPKVMEVIGSSEFWSLRATPDFVGTDEAKDIPLPSNVRRYYVAGTQHGGGKGGFNRLPAAADRPAVAADTRNPIASTGCVMPLNPNPMLEITRALLVDLKQWIAEGKEPPASVYPTLADHTLVPATQRAMGMPGIPGMPVPDGIANPLLVYDFGPDFRYNDLSGTVGIQPPALIGVLPAVVPRVDPDGNEVGGIHTVLQQAALGTYLGWNVTATGYLKGQYCSLNGGYVPFAAATKDRTASGDSRPSLEERYGTQDGYVCVVRRAAADLVSRRLLLPADAAALTAQAAQSRVLPRDIESGPEDRAIAHVRCEAQ